jgi:hypothetical protein
MPADPFIREKFTRAHSVRPEARQGIFREISEGSLPDEVESWRKLQSDNIEFTMKRLREPLK